MNETVITVAGNLVSDVQVHRTARGDDLARFRVASTATGYDRSTGQWVDGRTAYWNVTPWRRAAQNAAQSLAKGHPVVVRGRVRQRTVDREVEGSPGTRIPVTYTDLDALSLGLDLARCAAVYQRAPTGPQTRVRRVPVGCGSRWASGPARSTGPGSRRHGRLSQPAGSSGRRRCVRGIHVRPIPLSDG